MKSRNAVVIVLSALLLIFGLLGCSGSSGDNNVLQDRAPNGNKLVGKLVGGEITVSAASDDQQNPQVIYLSDKQMYFVVWEDWRNRNQSAKDDATKFAGADIWGKFINPDGTNCGSEFPITDKISGNQTLPQAAYRPGDKIVVTWQDTQGNSTSGYVRYTSITNIPSFNNITNVCSNTSPVFNNSSSVGFTGLKDYGSAATIHQADGPFFMNHSSSIGSSQISVLNIVASKRPIVRGYFKYSSSQVRGSDLGDGTIVGDFTGTVNYNTGSVVLNWTATAGNHDFKNLHVIYEAYSPVPGNRNDNLLSRKSPKIVFDSVRDEFWLGWVESRDINNMFSTECWGV